MYASLRSCVPGLSATKVKFKRVVEHNSAMFLGNEFGRRSPLVYLALETTTALCDLTHSLRLQKVQVRTAIFCRLKWLAYSWQ